MAGSTCTYERQNGQWVIKTPCAEGDREHCPPVPELALFQDLFNNSAFAFDPTDEIVILCDASQATASDETFLVFKQGATEHKLKYKRTGTNNLSAVTTLPDTFS